MLALEEYVEVHALRRRGWSISAIARPQVRQEGGLCGDWRPSLSRYTLESVSSEDC